MAKTLRVHQIAKELGVNSKDIVAKCEAESVPGIENHMSVVKLGLAETIRQWFSETDDGTAIERAAPVDIAKVAKKKARRKAAKKAGDHHEDDHDANVAVADEDELTDSESAETADEAVDHATPAAGEVAREVALEDAPEAAAEVAPEVAGEPAAAETPAQPTPDAPSAQPAVASQASQVEQPAPPAVEQPAAEAAKAPQPAAGAGDAARKPEAAKKREDKPVVPVGPMGRPNVPDRPNVIKPMGEQLKKPSQVTLKGPRVVRVEKPEPIAPPRPRRQPRQEMDQNNMDASPASDTGVTRSRGPKRGGGVPGGAGGGPDTDQGGKGGGKGGQRRQRNVRRGRSAEALPTGPSKFTQADLDELDARLKGAHGFVKQRRRDLRTREGGIQSASPAQVGGKVEIQEPITIKSFSSATGIKGSDVIKYLFKEKKIMATINSAIDTEVAMEVALEYNIELDVKEQKSALQVLEEEFKDREQVDVRPRPPIVTVLGHVDHGKTSLLDRIRKADVAAHEAGGITQHVGAYRVTIEGSDGKEKTVVFLDTPGHEAFTSMRARGAQLTDMIVLVVAADDGVMPQTIESINHAKAAGVPVIVALNKIDLPQATDANVHKIYGQLAEHGLNPSEWGGETEIIKTSAHTGQGVTDLLEMLDYRAELLELTADYGGPAMGTVIEAEMQPGRGSVGRVLLQNGNMKVGDFIVVGRAFGRVRDMSDDRNNQIQLAGPATPLELSGIDEVPDAGDKFYVTPTLQRAEQIASQYREVERNQQLATKTKVTLDNFAETLQAGQTNILRVVLKADVQGSIDVLRKSLEELGNQEVAVRVLHAAVGQVTESDVLLADASDAIIVGFHVIATPAVREIADQRHVEIRLYRIIYELVDEVKLALEGMLAPERKEEEVGTAEVREVFRITKLGSVAGCLVTDGSMQRDAKIRVVRNGVVVTDQRDFDSLRRVKDDVKEVRAGTECGIRIKNFEDVKNGDQIICYRVKEVKRKLE